MKKITSIIVLLLTFGLGYGQTTLSAGDIVITGFNSDDPDEFSFVLLTDIENTTTINFTDEGWLSSGGFRGNTEGIVTWTATSDLPCGTEITISEPSSNVYTATRGSVSETGLGFLLATTGDQILAYQGTTASPTFIYAINFDSAGWSNATGTNDTALPSGLTDTVNAVDVGETDNGSYDCSVTSDISQILSEVSDSSNWNLASVSRITLRGCYYSCASCTGGTVTWSAGNWSATPDLTTQVIIADDYDTSTGGTEDSFEACSVLVESGFTLNIADGDYLRVQNDITVSGTIVVQPEGAVVQVDNDGHVTDYGSITVTKKTSDLNAWYEYTYWSSPVSGEAIGDGLQESQVSRRFVFNAQNFLDATAETNNDNSTAADTQDDIDDNGDDWQWVSGATIMMPGVGYASTHDEAIFSSSPPFDGSPKNFTYTFEGPFNNGIITVPIYRNDSETDDNNWNLIGNPYPSAIDADLFLAANSAVNSSGVETDYTLDGAIFLWSQNTAPNASANGNQAQNFTDADYAIINGTGETAGGDLIVPTRYIPSGQAFFVTMSDSTTPVSTSVNGDGHTIAQANVTFNNSMRVYGASDNSQFFKNSKTKKSSSELNKIWVNLISDNGVFNQTLVGYVDGATDDFDGMYYDALKNVSTNTSASLYSIIDGLDKKFAIQGKSANSLNQNEIVQLGFKNNIEVPTLFKLSLAQFQGDFMTNNGVYLRDNLLNKVHNLSESDYTFTSEVGEFNNRFVIAFNNSVLSSEDALLDDGDLRVVNLGNDNVKFNVSNSLKINAIEIYDTLGRNLYTVSADSSSKILKLSKLKSSIFIARVTVSNGVVITKKATKN